MSATFTEDDLEKRVENANGEVIGTVTEIESEVAHVEPHSGVVDSIRSALGWGASSGEPVSIHAESVEEITVDTIRLEADSAVEQDAESGSEEPAPTAATGEAASTDLEGDSLDEPPATASSGSERESGEHGRSRDEIGTGTGAESDLTRDEENEADEIADTDRGIATGESERGISTDDSDRGIATGEPTRDVADDPSESVPPERRPEADDATGRDSTDRQDAFEEGGREHGETETEAMSGTTAEPETEAETRDEAGTIEATDRIDRAADEVEAGEFGDRDAPTLADDTDTGADTDADITTAANDETDTMESMNAAQGPGAIDNSEVGDSEIDDSSETTDAEHEHGNAADVDGNEAADHDEDVEHLEADPPIEPDPRTVSNDVSEPTELDADETIGHADETDIADEFSTGGDPDSLADVGGTDERTGRDATGTEPRDLTDAVDQGVDIESAADTGSETSSGVEETDTEAMDLTDEVDTGIDAASAVESEREGGMSADADAETSMEADAEYGAGIDIETLPGQQVDAEIGPEAGARRAMTEAGVSPDDIDRREADGDRTRDQAEADSQDTQEEAGSSPIAAVFATQRAATKSGQEAINLGLTTQQTAARAALEGTLLVQRGSLEIAETATRQYVNAMSAMMDIEELQSQVDDDDQLTRELETHRENVRELRATVDDVVDDDHELSTDRLVDLLERQADLLERCQQHLEGD